MTFSFTRMHSSRMHTANLLPISPSMHCLGGGAGTRGCTLSGGRWVPGPGGVGGVAGLGVNGRGVGVYLVRGCTWSQGVNLVWGYLVQGMYLVLGGVPGPGGCTWSGGCTYLGGTWSGDVPAQGRYTPPPVNRMTDRCKNITLPQTSFAGGNNCFKKTQFCIMNDIVNHKRSQYCERHIAAFYS